MQEGMWGGGRGSEREKDYVVEMENKLKSTVLSCQRG